MPDDPILTPEQVRERMPSGSPPLLESDFPDEVVARYIAEFEEVAEPFLGYAITPRTATTTLRVSGTTGELILPHSRVTSIESVAYDVGTAPDVADLWVDSSILSFATGNTWPTGRQVTFEYIHGLTETPEGLLRACVLYVAEVAGAERAGTSRDVLSQAFDGGGTTRYSMPDADAGRPTGWGEVDRLLRNYRPTGVGIA